MTKKADEIIPQLIPTLQERQTSILIGDIPDMLKQATYPFWLLWEPTPNNYKAPSKPVTKLLKRPTNPKWASDGETLQYDAIEEILLQRIDSRVSQIRKLDSAELPDDVYLQRKIALRPVGIGFKYVEEHGFICIDIDDMSEDNKRLVSELSSYTELSPSGKGYHVIVKCASASDKALIMEVFGSGVRDIKNHRDLFISTGFVTVTGDVQNDYSKDIRIFDTEDLIQILLGFFKPKGTYVADPKAAINAEAYAKKEKRATGNSKAPTKTSGKPEQQYQALTATQVKNMLAKIPVAALEEDIFDRLARNEYVVLDPDCTEEARTPWLIIGQAIHHNFDGKVEGYYLWDSWSKEGNKYDATACEATWRSFGESKRPITIGALIKLAHAQQPQFPDRTKKGALKGTLNNFLCYMQFFRFYCYHNTITKESEIDIPTAVLNRWQIPKMIEGQKLSLPEICELIRTDFIAMGFASSSYSATQLKRFITSLCKTNSFNPIKDYFEECGTNWDGEDRLEALMNSIVLSPSEKRYRRSYKLFLRKWLLQVVAAACHNAKRPVRLNRMLIFSGPQGIGKTKWVESLFPIALLKYCAADKELRLNGFRTDSVKQAMELGSTLICNINEVDRLFGHSAFSDFKAFLDQTVDKIVLPYGDAPTEVSRRTVFIGSTNSETFLKDITGNRRFEIIFAQKLNFLHGIDISQLWGQFHSIYKTGEHWWLDESKPDEARAIADRDNINRRFMFVGNDAFIEQLDYMFDTDASIISGKWELKTFKDIRVILGLTGLTMNSKAFNQTKRALHLWSEQVSGIPPQKGKGTRPRLYYTVPVMRENPEDVLPPEDDIIMGKSEKDAEVSAIQAQIAELNRRLANVSGSK